MIISMWRAEEGNSTAFKSNSPPVLKYGDGGGGGAIFQDMNPLLLSSTQLLSTAGIWTTNKYTSSSSSKSSSPLSVYFCPLDAYQLHNT